MALQCVVMDLGEYSVLAPLIRVELKIIKYGQVHKLLGTELVLDPEPFPQVLHLVGALHYLLAESAITLDVHYYGASLLNHYGVDDCITWGPALHKVYSWKPAGTGLVEQLARAQAIYARSWALHKHWLCRGKPGLPHEAGEMTEEHARYLRIFDLCPPGYLPDRLLEVWPASVEQPQWLCEYGSEYSDTSD